MRKNEGHKISKAPIAVAGMLALATSCARHSANEPRLSYRTHGVSQGLYAQRVRDQIDLETLAQQASALRFRFQSGIMRQEWGDDSVLKRESYAVPLGVETHLGAPSLAVLTTRCVLDYRYPLDTERKEWTNLALFSKPTPDRKDVRAEVFALATWPLPGTTGKYDPKRNAILFTSREYLEGAAGKRYFDQLRAGRVPLAHAELPVGQWENSSGVDLAIVYVPLRDPGAAALVPARHLGMRDAARVIREAMAGRQNLWGDTFEFELVSKECMKAAKEDYRDLERENKALLAVAIGLGLSIALPLLASDGSLQALSGMLATATKKAVQDTAWNTLTQVLRGEQITGVAWDSLGRLVLHHATNDPRFSQLVLSGVHRLGLSEAQAESVLSDVRHALSSPEAAVSVMTRPSGPPTASVFLKGRGIELAADLLRGGRVRLDLNDIATLAQQLGLLSAARNAVADPSTATELVSDQKYRSALTRVAEQIGAG